MYSHNNVLKNAIQYFNGDELAATVWMNKYCLKNNNGDFLEKSPEDMHKRLAKEFARIEKKYPNPTSEEKIFELIDRFDYIVPQGSPMSGIGNNHKIQSISNCFVIKNPYDSYAGIFKTEQEMVQLMKRRGGVGFSIHSLRPKEMPTSSVSEKSSGIVLFSERFSNGTREVAQDGRRGALMLSCRVDHPDIESFIDAKLDLKKITGANVSIMITDAFMEAVKVDGEYELTFIGEKGSISKKTQAKKVWDKIMFNAHKSAEPGILFMDTIHNESPVKNYGEEWVETSTNPCGEIPLCEFDSCRLLSLNLFGYVVNPFTPEAYFDFELFKEHVNYGQRMMDDIVDLELEKIDIILNKIENDKDDEILKQVERDLWTNIKRKAILGRRTGFGITAEGDMLAALNIRYGTPAATNFSIEVHKTLAIYSYKTSIDLAEERGCFPIWDKEVDVKSNYIQRILPELKQIGYEEKYFKFGRRNVANLTIAPAGSVSLLTRTTSGVEPAFMISYKRRKKINPEDEGVKVNFVDVNGDAWEEYNVFHPKFSLWAKVNGYDTDYIKTLPQSELDKIIEKSPYYKATSADVDWVEKVKMQGAIQKWIDHSISVTVNIPKETTVETVNKIYTAAWESGCKGMTIYRDGSRSGVMISNDEQDSKFEYVDSAKRPKELECDIHHLSALGSKWIVLIGLHNNKPYEIFALKDVQDNVEFAKNYTKGKIVRRKKGVYDLVSVKDQVLLKDIASYFETDDERASTRRYSLMLRHRIHPKYIVFQAEEEPGSIVAFNKAIARTLKKYLTEEDLKSVGKVCKECGSENLAIQEGCLVCLNCGSSKCG